MSAQTFDSTAYPIVLYDSQCLICDGFVRWVIRRDKDRILKFSGLLSDKARHEIHRRAIPIHENGSVILLQKDGHCTESDAVIEILKIANSSAALIALIQKFPKSWRDNIYRWVARNRYRFYKKRNYCPMPKPEEASRFV